MMSSKSLTSTYNKDLQESWEPMLDHVKTISDSIQIANGILSTLTIRPERMLAALDPTLLATDLADFLVRKGVPFRETHHVSGRVVAKSEELGIPMDTLSLEQLKAIDNRFTDDVMDIFNYETSVESRSAKGGTSRSSILEQIKVLKAILMAKISAPIIRAIETAYNGETGRTALESHEIVIFATMLTVDLDDSKSMMLAVLPTLFVVGVAGLGVALTGSAGVDLEARSSAAPKPTIETKSAPKPTIKPSAFTLTIAVWHISRDFRLKQKLMSALAESLPDREAPVTLLQLESIPYLSACVREALRMANLAPGKLPRVVPGGNAEALIVEGKVVPLGTIVGMSAYTMHTSEDIWGEDAREFNPDRWLGENGKHLDSYLATFSKGLRSCIGQNLASAELHITMAMLYRNFDINVDEASENFMALDYFAPIVPEPGLVLRVKKLD
ncbi:hypothetical protein NUW58_g5952 [Xylaria curta]|uniref:Uncharacterized protein n=1 Tax=Xylaria curta TaxID=42375 RepID=A0ACC1P0E1_9PEZI|nr:hypothetical protein NUW58_g5952 [Xylaria curta]